MNLSEHPLVSFLIPVKDEEKTLSTCLDAILALEYPSDKLEVLLALYDMNDASGKIAQTYASRHPNIILLNNISGNTSIGRNICLQHSKGEYVMNYSAHVTCPQDLLQVLVTRILASDEMMAGVGCSNINPSSQNAFGEATGYAFRSLLGGKGLFQQNASYDEERYVDHISFCLYKKELILDGFDPSLWVGQDAELDIRLKEKGYKILYTPDTRVYHQKRESPRGLLHQMYRYGVARAKIIRKHPGSMRWFYLLGPIFILGLFILGLLLSFHVIPSPWLIVFCLFYIILSVFVVLQWTEKPWVLVLSPLVFFLIHTGYGLGFLRGWLFKHKFSDGGLWGWI